MNAENFCQSGRLVLMAEPTIPSLAVQTIDDDNFAVALKVTMDESIKEKVLYAGSLPRIFLLSLDFFRYA